MRYVIYEKSADLKFNILTPGLQHKSEHFLNKNYKQILLRESVNCALLRSLFWFDVNRFQTLQNGSPTIRMMMGCNEIQKHAVVRF